MNKKQLQQGDVILKRVAELPTNSKSIEADPRGVVVLAEGETTGHFHGIKARKGLRLHKVDDMLFLENSTGVDVEATHQEHNPVTIEPGIWHIGQVREFDYLTRMERAVID